MTATRTYRQPHDPQPYPPVSALTIFPWVALTQFPWVWARGVVLLVGLLGCRGGSSVGAWAFVGSVAGAVHEDVVAGVDEPVEQGLGDDRVGEQGVPVG